MGRSVKKGPYVQEALYKRVIAMNEAGEKKVLGTVGLVVSIVGTVYAAIIFLVGICSGCAVCAVASIA